MNWSYLFDFQLLGEDDNQLAKDCLKRFSFLFGKIYGKNQLVYNVHSLIHLADDCIIHGPLDSFSCFPFETYLGKLKTLVRSSNRPLAQLVRRISELDYASNEDMSISLSIFNRNYGKTIMTDLKAATRSDSVYLTNNGVAVKVSIVII